MTKLASLKDGRNVEKVSDEEDIGRKEDFQKSEHKMIRAGELKDLLLTSISEV